MSKKDEGVIDKERDREKDRGERERYLFFPSLRLFVRLSLYLY